MLKDLSTLQLSGIALVVVVVVVAFVIPKHLFPCQCAQCTAESVLKGVKLQTVMIDGQEVLIPLEVQGGDSALSVKGLLGTLLALALCAIVLSFVYGKVNQLDSGRFGNARNRFGL